MYTSRNPGLYNVHITYIYTYLIYNTQYIWTIVKGNQPCASELHDRCWLFLWELNHNFQKSFCRATRSMLKPLQRSKDRDWLNGNWF